MRAGKLGRNEPCWCGSGKKYKMCCLARLPRSLAGLPVRFICAGCLKPEGTFVRTVHGFYVHDTEECKYKALTRALGTAAEKEQASA